MEKILTPEERIRRAEEIYYKRKINAENKNNTRVNVYENEKDFSLFKKMILQILICIVLYIIFYMITNISYPFSNNVINKTKEILSYDIGVNNLYNQFKHYIDGLMKKYNIVDILEEESIPQESAVEENANKDIEGDEVENNNTQEETNNYSQMENDAKDIISTKNFVIPLNGEITSRFGTRNSENPIVTKNHTGIDIGADEGTVFIASMSGRVKEVSNERRFGKSYKNCK